MKAITENSVQNSQKHNNSFFSDSCLTKPLPSKPVQEKTSCKEVNNGLLMAASVGDTQLIKKYLGMGADKNAVDDLGRDSLILASLEGHCDAIKLLVNAGIRKYHKDKSGLTALMHTAISKQMQACRLLVKILVGTSTCA